MIYYFKISDKYYISAYEKAIYSLAEYIYDRNGLSAAFKKHIFYV